jgi:hypothetical protein
VKQPATDTRIAFPWTTWSLPPLLHQQEKTTMSPEHTRERAEALFKRKEETRIEGDKAKAEYEARQQALR